MHVAKKEGLILNRAIEHWQTSGELSAEQAKTLRDSYKITPFDWKRLTKYAFWLAIACTIIAISAVLADQWLVALLQRLFTAPASVKSISFALIAGIMFGLGIMRKRHHPKKIYSNEAIMFLGVTATAISIAFLGKALDTGSDHFSLLLLLAALIYAALGLWFPSTLIWVFSLLSLGSWFGAETGYASGWGAYYLGMNYPLRFVLFGLVLIFVGGHLFRFWQAREVLLKPTRAMGLLYLFIALWILSIFGNYGDAETWQSAKQIELFHWSLIFAAAAMASIFHGIRHDDGMTRGFGLTFIFINLYTRFFEYCWDATHKAVFFTLLAISFWYLGTKAETIWNLSFIKQHTDKS